MSRSGAEHRKMIGHGMRISPKTIEHLKRLSLILKEKKKRHLIHSSHVLERDEQGLNTEHLNDR